MGISRYGKQATTNQWIVMTNLNWDQIEWKQLESSNIEAVAFQTYGGGFGVLHVKFKNGGKYKYHGVPLQIFEEIQMADSAGKYLNEQVKGKFDVEKY